MLIAAFEDGSHIDLIQPYALRAPEVILGGKWGASADVWNLGCLVCLFLILNSSDIEIGPAATDI